MRARGVGSVALTLMLTGLVAAQTAKTPPKMSGEALFAKQCASCHGAKGEGASVYPKPLAGTLSVAQLSGYLTKNMPPGTKHIGAADAQKVAGYIHEAFYSPIAQERNRPARVALSRLTVRQYRHLLSDLVTGLRSNGMVALPIGTERGLKAEYFKANRMGQNERLIQRIDAQVAFDFGTKTPPAEGFDPYLFSIRWEGSLVAPDTGEYEIVIRTDQAGRVWLNDNRKPLIDAWVKSGKDTEYRATAYLLAGRAYPLRFEFSKSIQGVDDPKKLKEKPVQPAFVTLAWRRPHLAEEPIPSRCLLPVNVPESYVVNASFPPDDRSMGYERGNAISKAWEEATTTAALDVARYLVEKRAQFAKDGEEKAFCRRFVERAFRRPLTDDEVKRYVEQSFTNAPDVETALKRVVLRTLKSPYFLYNIPTSDGYATATRLSLALWDSAPDNELWDAAAQGKLATREGVQAQAERMVRDPRAWGKLREFLLTWLRVDEVGELVKDTKRFPGFDSRVSTDLRTSLELFLESTVWSEKADFRELLLGNTVYLNGRLAPLYNVNLPADAPFQPVTLDASERAGVLTQPYLLAHFAYLSASSPIHRGVLLSRSFLGRVLAPPPVAVAPVAPDLHPKLTTRQRVSLQTKPTACQSCHNLINPLGFALERFDAIGKLRTVENDQKVDATGSYKTRAGKTVTFHGARDLAKFLSESDEVHTAFVEKLFQYTTKQPIRAYGAQTQQSLLRNFTDKGYNIRTLLTAIAVEAACKKGSS